MIRLKCPACGCSLQVEEARGGGRGRCPKCNHVIAIPTAAGPAPPPVPPAQDPDKEVTLVEGEMRLKERPPDQPKPEAEPPSWALAEPPALGPRTPKGLRRHPWLIDVLLYPSSASGMVNLGVFAALLLVSTLLWWVYIPYGGLLRLILGVSITSYLVYYLTDCVRDSADGGTGPRTTWPAYRPSEMPYSSSRTSWWPFSPSAFLRGCTDWLAGGSIRYSGA